MLKERGSAKSFIEDIFVAHFIESFIIIIIHIVFHPCILGFVMEFPKGDIVNVYVVNSMNMKIHELID